MYFKNQNSTKIHHFVKLRNIFYVGLKIRQNRIRDERKIAET